MTENTDLHAIERCRQGDRNAFEQIVKRYSKPAYYLALSYVGRPDDALDLSQDAFVNAYRHLKRFDSSKRFFPWFYSILRNLCLNHLNRSRGRKEDSIEGLEEQKGPVAISIKGKNPEQLLIEKDLAVKIGRALRRLRVHEREIIILQHFQDYSYQEIADLLEIPIGTVMSRLYGARRSLGNELRRRGVRY